MTSLTLRAAPRPLAAALATLATLATLLAGCATDAPLGLRSPSPTTERLATAVATAPAVGAAQTSEPCANLHAPAGNRLALRAYATGVQIYRWNGATWTFVAPVADLFSDPQGQHKVAIHYAGPTWQSVAGGTVVGAVDDRCTPNAAAIPWLLLHVASASGPGDFARMTFIQRVRTVGGTAPSLPGSAIGEQASVPYTAEYVFYRAS